MGVEESRRRAERLIAQACDALSPAPPLIVMTLDPAALDVPDSEQFSAVLGAFTSRWRAAHLSRMIRAEVATSRGSRRRR